MDELMGTTYVDVESDEAVIALVDALVELDAADQLYPADEADLLEADRRAQGVFDRAALEDEDALQTLIAEVTINEVESWLTQEQIEGVRSVGMVTVSTVDRSAPKLADLGYATEFEVDADVDRAARRADVSVTLRSIVDEPAGLDVVVIGSDGSERSAVVNRYGLAVASGVPIDTIKPPKIRLTRRELR